MCKRIFIGLPEPITAPHVEWLTPAAARAYRNNKRKTQLSEREREVASRLYKVTPQGSIYQPLSPPENQAARLSAFAEASEDTVLTWSEIDRNDADQNIVGSRFTLPFVYEINPLHECSCSLCYSRDDIEFDGFHAMPYEMQQNARDNHEARRALVRAFGALLAGELAATHADYIEVYGTWYGDESDPPLPLRTVTLDYFGGEAEFEFTDNEPLRVEAK